jgi:hypothetical protein
MKSFDKAVLERTLFLMGRSAMFMYDQGEEKKSWEWLFMREFYKDLWKAANVKS